MIIGGYVGEHEAGQRLFQVAHDPRCKKSGVYWSWNGGPREGRGVEALEKGGQISGGGGAGGGWDSIFENDQSAKVLDIETAIKLFKCSTEITGAEWPELKAITSPCPTLKVISAVTKGMVQREELKRMRELGRPGMEGGIAAVVKVAPPTPTKKAVLVADKVVAGTLRNTVGRVARFASRRLLGELPPEAKNNVVVKVPTATAQDPIQALEEGQMLLHEEIAAQLSEEGVVVDHEDMKLFQQIYDGEITGAKVPAFTGKNVTMVQA
jgi:hypothetical protein